MMNPPDNSKIEYYSRQEVVDRYDAWRFGSHAGRHAGQREIGSILRYLDGWPRDASILDMPVGTGRLAGVLLDSGFTDIHGCDASAAMLTAANRRCRGRIDLVRGDAFATTYASARFDIAVVLRFFFHYPETNGLLEELHRILKPGGLLIFDTLRWSPRSVAPWLQRALGGIVYPRRDDEIAAQLAACNFSVERRQRVLLLPSLAYRFVPGMLLKSIDRVEAWAPSRWRSKSLWLARKCE